MISASFVAEPIDESIAFWSRRLGVGLEVQHAPFNQVFQQLLDPASLLRSQAPGTRVVLLRAVDYPATAHAELASTLQQTISQSPHPWLVLVCPSSPAFEAAHPQATATLAEQLKSRGIEAYGPAEVLAKYPVADYADTFLEAQASLPFTRAFYAALGTWLVRHASRAFRVPLKALAIDCDHTLWGGVCAEDGCDHLRLDGPYDYLQHTLKSQAAAGRLLCLCSRNEAPDVEQAFTRNAGRMALQLADVTAARINWNPKSQNVRELATELNLSPNAFMLIDDDPVHCADVMHHGGGALAAHVPSNPDEIPAFLDHLWPLDAEAQRTREDALRGSFYAQSEARESLRADAGSLTEFLERLQIVIDIEPATAEHAARIAQLSQRTNQFNLSGKRRTAAEVQHALESGALAGRVVSVRDRFGDYGLVGVLLYALEPLTLTVDSWLLSCRALGRGVEHRMLNTLGTIAQQAHRGAIALPFAVTDRNAPVRSFLESVPGLTITTPDTYTIAATAAERVTPEIAGATQQTGPVEARPAEAALLADKPVLDAPLEALSVAGADVAASIALVSPQVWSDIARELNSVERILAAIDAEQAPAEATRLDEAASDTERDLLALWARLLRVPDVRPDDDFFALGGHSLLATRMVAEIAATMQVEVPLPRIFECATVRALAAVIDELRLTAPAAAPTTLVAAPGQKHQPFPLTDLQQAYWIGRQGDLGLGGVGTHNYHEIEIADFDIARFETAWNHLIQRHDLLRTIVTEAGEQVILAEVPRYTIEVTDLRKAAEPATALNDIQQRMSHQVLDLTRWPCFELRAIQMPGNITRLHMSFDGLFIDLSSVRILMHEAATLYHDAAAELPPIHISFRDYVLAERAARHTPAADRAWRYWTERLATLPPAPALPLAAGWRSHHQPRFVRRSGRLSREHWSALQRQAQQARITPSGLLAAAYAELLARFSQEPRFTLNVTLFNRPPLHPEMGLLVGNFTYLSLLACEPGDGVTSFRERAQQVSAQLWNDLEHRQVNGVEIMRELVRQRGPAMAMMPVVFTSALGLDVPAFEEAAARLGACRTQGLTQTPQVVLDHLVAEVDGALEYSWDCVEALFPAGFVDVMFDCWNRMLERLADDAAVWDVAPGSWTVAGVEPEWTRYNDTERPMRRALLHELFEEQAARVPQAEALVWDGGRLTYLQLLHRARHLAHRLASSGLRPAWPVGVCIPKGPEQVVAVLGILMAGGAYLPIDAALPEKRRHGIVEHAGVRHVVVEKNSTAQWPPSVQRHELDLDLETLAPAPLHTHTRDTDLAYVIYTSGSTGRPKGVMIDHRGAVNTCLDVNERFGIGAGDRVLALSSLGFDLSVYDIFGILGAGGCIVMPRADDTYEPRHWVDLVNREHVTVWNSVPALMKLAVEQQIDMPTLRVVMLSGDWIPLDLPPAIARHAAHARLYSLGGATEASIWSIFYPVSEVRPEWTSIPYGMPMYNQRFYVLDEALVPRPVGVPGRLYIGGIGVALGYWNDAERTAERFITHPETGERLYWTGDLGRLTSEGWIEFMGREDFQVKIHGYRIELGEIEAVLLGAPGVQAAVASAIGEARGSKQLVAHVVADRAVASAEQLKAWVRERLPQYMVPQQIFHLEALPLSSNGKVDRSQLVIPQQPVVEAVVEAPRDYVEYELIRIWKQELNLETVSRHDNFFDLGGHSLAAMRLVHGIERGLGARVQLMTLFENPTIAQLAERLRGASAFGSTSCLVPIRVGNPASGRAPFFCVHGLTGSVHTDLARHLHPDQPYYGLQPKGLHGDCAPAATVEEMAAAYVEAIQRVQPHGPYHLGGYCMGGVVALEMARQLEAAGETVAEVVSIDTDLAPHLEGWRYAMQTALRQLEGLRREPHRLKSGWSRRFKMMAERLRVNLGLGGRSFVSLSDLQSGVVTMPGMTEWPDVYKRIAPYNQRALLGHKAAPWSGKVVLIRAESRLWPLEDATLGWKRVSQQLSVFTVPFGHDDMMNEPHVEHVGRIITALLDTPAVVSAPAAGLQPLASDSRVVPIQPVSAEGQPA
jgi:amino acid adenylation domain-containing protein/FkbH-like protein